MSVESEMKALADWGKENPMPKLPVAVDQAALIRELAGVVKRALPYCGPFQLPPALILDMKVALSRVPEEYK